MTRTMPETAIPLAQVYQPCAAGMDAARGLADASPTFREALEIDRALAAVAAAARELGEAWRSLPGDAVFGYPFNHSADENPEGGYVHARAETLAQILREAGHPAYTEADGALVFYSLDGHAWRCGLAGWVPQREDLIESGDAGGEFARHGALEPLEALAAAEADYNRTAGMAPMPLAQVAPLLVDALRGYNADVLPQGV